MAELEVLRIDGKNVIDSRVVAETIDTPHSDLLKKIRNYESVLLKEKFPSMDFFVPNEYKDSIGRKLPCYLLTKQGCEMVANKLIGEKGIMFTAAYVATFNKMEESSTKNALCNDFREIPIGELGSYLRVVLKEMKDAKKSPKERLEVIKRTSEQFGVILPDDFADVKYEQLSLL